MMVPNLSLIRLPVFAILLLAVTACAQYEEPTKPYQQPRPADQEPNFLPAEKVATLYSGFYDTPTEFEKRHGRNPSLQVIVWRLDEKPLDHPPPELLYDSPPPSVKILPGPHIVDMGDLSITFEAEAGHTYQPRAYWGDFILRTWIEEVETRTVVGMASIKSERLIPLLPVRSTSCR
jgi:hypothetical protein